MTGETVGRPEGIDIDVGGDTIAVVTLGWDSARARGRVADLTRAAWVTIEVSRLRQVLRDALDEVVSSQARLSEAAVGERRRLERDLHDGAQQRIVATGMRLRVLQRHLTGDAENEVETAVAELEETVRELRDIAHGVRPVRLSDGLGAALEVVRATSPVPLTLSVHEPADLDESRRLTAYLVVSEAVTNALKHASASRIDVTVADHEGLVAIGVCDDGVGGVPELGLTALRDRVRSVGGHVSVDSPDHVGTTVTALL
jgi:signal transduction histidine kinase